MSGKDKEETAKQDDRIQKTTWEDIIKIVLEKSEDPLSAIINALRGHPEQIKAEYRLTMTISICFVALMFAIIGITGYLVIIGKLGGETVAFIFGTAFGSVITFLYRYLAPQESE